MRTLISIGLLVCALSAAGCRQRLVVAGATQSDAGESSLDSGAVDSGPLSDSGMDGGGGGLDPDLALADESAASCTFIGTFVTCVSTTVCGFFSQTEGRCVTCDGSCAHVGESCTRAEDCDTVSACYQGRCTPYCELGSLECGGPPDDCLDVGHPTTGVCRL